MSKLFNLNNAYYSNQILYKNLRVTKCLKNNNLIYQKINLPVYPIFTRNKSSLIDHKSAATTDNNIDLIDSSTAQIINGVGGGGGTIFSDLTIVVEAQKLLCSLHDFTGSSWASTIILTTIGIRVFIGLPLAIIQQRSLARFMGLKPEFEKLGEELKKETAKAIKEFKWDEKTAKNRFNRSYKKHWTKLVEDNNCHPIRSIFLIMLQIPFWICFSSAIRNIVYMLPEPKTIEKYSYWLQISQEKFFWINSLASPDRLIIPITIILVNLLNVQIHAFRKVDLPQTKLQKAIPWIIRVASVSMGILAIFVPSAVSLYWVTSSSANLTQNLVLKNSKLRKLLKLPIL